jgi:NADPH:quinone reductase-like Zn-dependent oxidoreductase
MNAITFKRYGTIDVLNYESIEVPILGDDQVLIQVHYASVNPVDWKVRKGIARFLTGLFRPKKKYQILGADVSGTILSVGETVDKFNINDAVFAILGGIPGGGYAEQIVVNANQVALIPKSLDFKKSAAVPLTGLTALQGFLQANIQHNQRILINGASGGVGIFAVQIAKAYHAKTTAVCSQQNVELIRGLGADSVIDYQKEDFTKTTQTFDIIFDAVGNQSFQKVKSILSKDGVYITTIPNPIALLQAKILSYFSKRQVVPIMTKNSGEDLKTLAKMIDNHQFQVPIDAEFPLKNAAAAHDYSETNRVKGKLILRIFS